MNLMFSKRLTIAACAAALLITGVPRRAAAMDQDQFNKLMDSYLESDENLEKVGTALEKFFRKKREEQQALAEQQEVQRMEEQFENPVKIDVAGSPVIGKENAPITVVEFSDFQCPFCKRGNQVMKDLLKEYPDDVKIVFKHLPLPFHQQAKPAAVAAIAAQQQGKFWEFHDELFENQESLTEAKFIEIATKLELDVDKFKKDMNNEAYEKQVADDMAVATQLGVRGTPGFFVNGVQVRGARPLPYFKELVDKWKERMAKK
ncbi:MAG: thioredoxin domain-containing protein [Bdellovibrionales bacterium]|nr:thioredoxin domain-containing protein [Bdellovibrionales bacterium]